MNLVLRYNLEGRPSQATPLDQPTLSIGCLASNKVILPGAEPVHGIIEQLEDGQWRISDLGSNQGIYLNNVKIDVETILKLGDIIRIGKHLLTVDQQREVAPLPALPSQNDRLLPNRNEKEIVDTEITPKVNSPSVQKKFEDTAKLEEARSTNTQFATTKKMQRVDNGAGVRNAPAEAEPEKVKKLFVNRDAKAGGDVLEVVSYWGNSVLEIEHYTGGPGSHTAKIGTPPADQFIAAGDEDLSGYTLARVIKEGYKIYLKSGMKARLRRSGKIDRVEEGKYTLGQRDIAQVKYGPVSYFILYVRPPALEELKRKALDPLMFFLLSVMSLIMIGLIPVLVFGTPSNPHDEKDDPWAVVTLPEKPIEEVKIPPPPKPKVEIVKEEKPPEKVEPPKPVPPPPKPAEPKTVVEKPKQEKPVEKPVEVPKTNIAQQIVQPPTPKPAPVPVPTPQPKVNNGLVKTNNAPDNKAAGQKQPNKAVGASGGPVGGGNPTAGAPRKGDKSVSVKGVEGPKNTAPSGVNLSSLGLGVGKVINKTAPGAIMTNFQNSAGGAGGGSGSAAKTLGMGGGIGTGKSIGLGGTSGAANNFGSGTGGLLSGQGGSGGRGSGAFGSGAGRGQVNVHVSEGGAPGVDGGLTQQEVAAVIRSHLNEIRHCYEQLLQRAPSSAGKVQVKFTVAPTGRVSTASIANSSISDAQLQGCIVGKIRSWTFPVPRGGQPVHVDYPFVFNPI